MNNIDLINMTTVRFSHRRKMADLIHANYNLIGVLSRFGIDLGFGEKSVEQTCCEEGISSNLFLIICNIYADSSYIPAKEELTDLPVEELVIYLRNSHNDYRENHLKWIDCEILEYSNKRGGKNSNLLVKFFESYCAEVENHFRYEEEVLFPYIERLLNGKLSLSDFNVSQFEKNHSNIEEKLSDLKNILIKYIPCSDKNSKGVDIAQSRLLYDLFRLEEDLAKHTLIEEKLLVPIVYQLERKNR